MDRISLTALTGGIDLLSNILVHQQEDHEAVVPGKTRSLASGAIECMHACIDVYVCMYDAGGDIILEE
jgi:hypothetical protein